MRSIYLKILYRPKLHYHNFVHLVRNYKICFKIIFNKENFLTCIILIKKLCIIDKKLYMYIIVNYTTMVKYE